jgi:hypothetical protein
LLVDKLSADECAVLSGGVDEMQRHIENEIKEKCAEIDALGAPLPVAAPPSKYRAHVRGCRASQTAS